MCYFYTPKNALSGVLRRASLLMATALMFFSSGIFAQCPPSITLAAPSICDGQEKRLVLNTSPSTGGPYTIVVNGTTYSGIVPGTPFRVGLPDDFFWDTTVAPPVFADSDPYELGFRFIPNVGGFVKGIRFYKDAAATGPFTGSLWSNTGALIATGTFTVTGDGWQELIFSTPILVTAGVPYVASYYSPNGNYAFLSGGLLTAQTSPGGYLSTVPSGPGQTNGLFRAGSPGFPTSSFADANYFVDVVFTPSEDALWPSTPPPVASDPDPYELGMKFTANVDGRVEGVRFYKPASVSGTFTGSLWSITGTQLATGTFTTTPEGWQELRFATPVTVTAGTSYVASYSTPGGGYAFESGGLATARTSIGGNFTAPASGGPLGGNGVFNAGGPGFPTATFSSSNYFVDVIFRPETTNDFELTSITDGAACSLVGAPISSATLTINDNPEGVLTSSGTQVAGQPSSIIFTASSGTNTYSLTINGTGYTPVTSGTPFTTGVIPQTTPVRIWSQTSLPPITSNNDGLPVEVGMKFRPTRSGSVTALRFYKGVSDLLPTELKLYTAAGTLLATVTHQDATLEPIGWREVTLPTPVSLVANQLYVVSYYSDNGDYVFTTGFLTSDFTSGPFVVPAPGGPAGGNGVFLYGAGGGFPTNFFGPTGGPNYWADVVYLAPTLSLPLELTSITDGNGCTSVVSQFVQFSVQNSLPVSLRSFTASVNGSDVRLDWSTASESNNRGFEILRSDDGSKFVSIGFVEGAGNSQVTRNYTFTDRNRPTGRFFYRLRQVDLDGRFSLSNIVNVEINGRMIYDLGQSYPNPTHGAATITYSVPVKTNVRLVLYDAQGRVVSVLQNGERPAGKYAITVPENLLKKGMYYYKMEAGGFITTRKMIVQ